MADFRNQFFLAPGADTPSYPPLRIRLPNGNTRYTYSCTKEDLNVAGYEGPFEVPSVSGTDTVAWDADTKTFIVVVGDTSPDPIFEDARIRQYIQSVIESINNAILTDATPEFLVCLNNIKDAAWVLLNSSKLLTNADLPSFNLPPITRNAVYKEYLTDAFEKQKDFWKYTYETYGFIIGLDPQWAPYFIPPSDWVLNRKPMEGQHIYDYPNGIAVYSGIDPSGQVIYNPCYPSGSSVLSGMDLVYNFIIGTNYKFF